MKVSEFYYIFIYLINSSEMKYNENFVLFYHNISKKVKLDPMNFEDKFVLFQPNFMLYIILKSSSFFLTSINYKIF